MIYRWARRVCEAAGATFALVLLACALGLSPMPAAIAAADHQPAVILSADIALSPAAACMRQPLRAGACTPNGSCPVLPVEASSEYAAPAAPSRLPLPAAAPLTGHAPAPPDPPPRLPA